MKKTITIFLIVFALVFLWWILIHEPRVEYGPGQLAPDIPLQTSASGTLPIEFNGYQITFKAKFNIKARVLSRQNYSRGRESDLSPTDLVLGWGNMSDESIYDKISFSQRDRWFFWRTDRLPIPKNKIENQCANMHIIPSNNEVRTQLDNTVAGDLIQITGFLVYVNGSNNWKWQSSLTRNDTGGGSCEIIWAESFNILNPLTANPL